MRSLRKKERSDYMRTYQCFFDGAHRPHISATAFCVFSNGHVVYSKSYSEKLPSSYHAEMRAFYYLLQYIQCYIEPGNKIEIYGDHKGIVDSMHSEKELLTFNKNKEFFVKLQSIYSISLQHIPRNENRIAHNLAKIEKKHNPKGEKFETHV